MGCVGSLQLHTIEIVRALWLFFCVDLCDFIYLILLFTLRTKRYANTRISHTISYIFLCEQQPQRFAFLAATNAQCVSLCLLLFYPQQQFGNRRSEISFGCFALCGKRRIPNIDIYCGNEKKRSLGSCCSTLRKNLVSR